MSLGPVQLKSLRLERCLDLGPSSDATSLAEPVRPLKQRQRESLEDRQRTDMSLLTVYKSIHVILIDASQRKKKCVGALEEECAAASVLWL